MDKRTHIALETKELKLQRYLEDFRERMLDITAEGLSNPGFWLDQEDDEQSALNPGAIRVLVCGNTGVGKSTLINKMFGVDVTTTSNRSRGIHDVRQEITFEDRPDLIVHDSGGFEAGADEKFMAIEAFLEEKSVAVDVKNRVHVIWFCVDINSPRTLQTATEKLFRAVSLYTNDVPIIVVATKKDDLLDIEFGKKRKAIKQEGRPFDEEVCQEYAVEKLRERTEMIQSEMQSVSGGRLDACVATFVDDKASIADLSKITASTFNTDKSRKVSTDKITKAIVNCFGLPTVSTDATIEALKKNIWTTAGTNIMLALAEGLNIVGILATAATGGIAGAALLITGGINSAAVVPTTCHLFLVMSCDLMLVLARSFKEVTFRQGSQPTERDLLAAARNYRLWGYSQHVRNDLKKLVPRKNMRASFKVETIGQELEQIVVRYKDKFMNNVRLPLKVGRTRIGSTASDNGDIDSAIFSDLLRLRRKYGSMVYTTSASLAPTDINSTKAAAAELDGGQPAGAEAPGHTQVAELPMEGKELVEMEASQTFAELPERFKKRLEMGKEAGGSGDVKRR